MSGVQSWRTQHLKNQENRTLTQEKGKSTVQPQVKQVLKGAEEDFAVVILTILNEVKQYMLTVKEKIGYPSREIEVTF